VSDKHLVLVVGVGRSGTSLFAGILGQLGFQIPQPEVQADETNPRGFGEPQWVVDFHSRVLRSRRVMINDARPSAWEAMAGLADDGKVREELRGWLAGQLREGDAFVVKDPRTVWFLDLWTRCAADLGMRTSFVTMLRHPAEIVASARKSYGDRLTEAGRAASWINVTLETERLTRGDRRVFVRYEELLADWVGQIRRVGAALEVPALAAVERVPEVDAFVDPTLHRNRTGWDRLDVPPSVVALADETWAHVDALADSPASEAPLDAARGAYASLYSEAEAIAQSSILFARSRPGSKRGAAPAPAPSLRVRIARRIPARYRRRLRAALRNRS
jgi:hypothetical protein